jgi:hypothetical protein
MKRKQWLSKKYRARRMAWWEQYAHFLKDDWCDVIFSDESTFHVVERQIQVTIWRTDKDKIY